jgi:hypothetical protein
MLRSLVRWARPRASRQRGTLPQNDEVFTGAQSGVIDGRRGGSQETAEELELGTGGSFEPGADSSLSSQKDVMTKDMARGSSFSEQ